MQAAPDATLAGRRDALTLPAVLGTVLALPPILLAVAMHVVAIAIFRAHPEWLTPDGATYVPPSSAERAGIILRAGLPAVLGLGLLVLTWRLRRQGRQVATTACAAGAVLMGVVALLA